MSRSQLLVAIAFVMLVLVSAPTATAVRGRSPPAFTFTNVGPPVVGPNGYLGFSATVSDKVAVASVVGTIVGPLPSTAVLGTVALSLVSGTAQSGLWNGTFQFPSTAQTGNYTTAMTATDMSGNSVTVTTDPVSVDADPPRLIFPPDLYPRYVGPNGFLRLTVTLADNLAVGSVWGSVAGPNNPSAFVGYISMYEYYGTPQYGNWTGTITFPAGAREGDYAVSINATDAVGNFMSAVAGTTTVDRTPPETTITSAADGKGNPVPDGGTTKSTSITFTFAGTDANGVAGFYCSLDSGPFFQCWSGITYTNLAKGTHTFQVEAFDLAGNVDPTPASFVWIVRH